MSRKSLALSGAVSLALAVLLCGGCKSPQVLEDRGNVPAPEMTPGETATVEGMSPEATPTATELPPLKGAGAPGPAVTVTPPSIPPVPAEAKAMPSIPPFDYSAFKAEQLSYTVKQGDSFWTVAKMYGVSVNQLAAVNKLSTQKALHVGQVLQIPQGGALSTTGYSGYNAAPASKGAAAAPGKGSKVHGVAAVPGKPVPVKSVAGKGSAAAAPGVYVVKSGDNPWLIAKRHHVTRKALLEANKWPENKRLKLGEKVIIPGKSGASAAVAVAAPAAHGASAKKASASAASAPAAAPASAPAAAGKEIKSETEITAEEKTTTTTAAGGEEEIDEFLSADSKTNKKGVTTTNEELDIKVDDTSAAAAAPKAKEPSYLPHPVNEAGVTFSKLSEMYGVKIEKLKEANPGLSADKELPVGTKVRIPEE